MIFHTYEWKKEYKPSSLMKGLELLKEKFEHYQLREGLIQKFHYYTENVNGSWISFPIIQEKNRVYFSPIIIEPFDNELYETLEDLQIKFLMRINAVSELKDKFIIK